MPQKTNLLSKIKNIKLFKNKHIAYSVAILLLCIAVLITFSGFKKTKVSQTETAINQVSSQESSALQYASSVSKNLQDIINNVKGISNAKVVVVVEQSPKIEYLTDSTSKQTAVVYNKQGANYQPVAVVEFLPKITGILVVANGTTNLAVKNNLLNAISAVYNLEISRIDILEGK